MIQKCIEQCMNYVRILIVASLLGGGLVTTGLPELPNFNVQPYLQQLAEEEPEDQVRVIVQTSVTDANLQKEVRRLGGSVIRDLAIIHAFVADLPAKAVPILAANTHVRWISLDAPVHSTNATDGSQPNVRDDFNTPVYDGSNGGRAWLGPWQELGESDGPQLGDVAITDFWGGALQGLRIQNGSRGALRLVDLAGATDAALTIAYRRKDFGDTDTVMVQVSSDGGLTWFDLEHLAGPTTDAEIQYANYDISGFIAPQSAIRFVSAEGMGSDAKFYLDSLNIQANWPGVDLGALPNKLFLPLVFGHGVGAFTNLTAATPEAEAFDKAEALDSNTVTAAAGCTYQCFDLTKLLSTYDKAIGADQIWNVSPYRRGWQVGVAVVDSGITPHPDLNDYSGVSRLIKQVQFGATGGTPDDFYGHGTHIAGTIGGLGTRSNGGYVGVAPEAKFIDVKVINDYGYGITSDVVAGLQWIYNNRSTYNIKIANLSLNSVVPDSYHTSPLDAALEILWFNKIVVVVSAGNKGSQHLYPPANDPFVITVGAVDDKNTPATTDEALASFSAFGITESGFAKPDILAPGVNIIAVLASDDSNLARDYSANKVTAATGYSYFKMSGTSMAAAVVSGAVAILLEDEPTLTPDQVKYRLGSTARSVSSPFTCATGAGSLDLYAAVNGTTTQSANTGVQASQMLWSGLNPITWGSVNWNSVNWNSVNWNSVNWNSVNWNSVNWNSGVWDSAAWNSSPLSGSSTVCAGITSTTLINADTDQDIQPLFPGAVIDLRPIGTKNLSVRAVVAGPNESAIFDLDSASYTKVENTLPYAIAGDNAYGDYAGVTFAPGFHTLKITPYTYDNGAGSVGNSITVSFRVATSLQAVHSNKCLDVPNGSKADGSQFVQNSCTSAPQQLFELKAVAGKTNTYNLINTNSNKCVGISSSSTGDGAALIQWTCTGVPDQQYELRTVTGAGSNVYNLVALHSNKCLDVNGASLADGATIIQWPCHGGANQQWRLMK